METAPLTAMEKRSSRLSEYCPDTDEQTSPTRAAWHLSDGNPPEAEVITPSTPHARMLSELVRPQHENDPNELLQNRFLCRGGGLLLCGPTGIGKSSFTMQCAILWALGRECFDIKPARPIKSLIIQAENDEGDEVEMRDGVIEGLSLNAEEAKTACEKIRVLKEDSQTGFDFFQRVVRPLLEEHRPDLLWIDPAFAYLGGEATSQKDVTQFLRNFLNPLLGEFNCGGVIVHHTNKPPSSRRDQSTWSGNDFAYAGSGSSEWANWARAVLVIRGTASSKFFELVAGKRGARLCWQTEDGSPSRTKSIAHSTIPGAICWQEANPDEVIKTGRPKRFDADEMVGLLPIDGLTTTEWQKVAREEFGTSESSFHRLRRELSNQKQVTRNPQSKRWERLILV
jgi:hypothetical protein